MVAKRNPDQTREKLVEAAFSEIYRSGFRAASVDAILSKTGVTKGALYHHFRSKAALGYAVVEEVIRGHIVQGWLDPLRGAENPLDALIGMLRRIKLEDTSTACEMGCPLNNLAQEMSPIDEGFRQRLHAIYREWRQGIAEGLIRAQERGYVRADIDAHKVATFFVAALEGALGLAKNARDGEVLLACRDSMVQFLESLRLSEAKR